MNKSQAIEWRIQPGRVGPVELGKPLPGVLLVADLEAHYLARYVADAQPIDAFRFDDPPLVVVLASGPFAEAVATGDAGEDVPPADRWRGAAAELARRGTAVNALWIHAKGPKTDAGVGVGSLLAELEAAYPTLTLLPQPEMLGDDACVARSSGLPGVAFVFASCAKARSGQPVTRIELWP